MRSQASVFGSGFVAGTDCRVQVITRVQVSVFAIEISLQDEALFDPPVGVIWQSAAGLHSDQDGQAGVLFVSEQRADLDARLTRSLPGTVRLPMHGAAGSGPNPLHEIGLQVTRRFGFRGAEYDLTQG